MMLMLFLAGLVLMLLIIASQHGVESKSDKAPSPTQAPPPCNDEDPLYSDTGVSFEEHCELLIED